MNDSLTSDDDRPTGTSSPSPFECPVQISHWQVQTPYLLDDDKEAGRSPPVPGRASTPLCFRVDVLTCVRARATVTVTGDGHEPRSVTGGEEVFFKV